MPTLIGNENIGFELKLTEPREEAGQKWQDYELIFHINGKTKRFFNQAVRHCQERSDEAIHLVELSDLTVGRFSFNLSERNEITILHEQIKAFIENPAKQELFFEPADPSFELRIERTRHNEAANKILDLSEEEFKIYLWIDGGNSTRLMYAWDAEGIRFLASKTAINGFIEGLSLCGSKALL